MNRPSIRQSDLGEYIKSTKLIPSSNPLKLPSPDQLTGREQISLTENPISLSQNLPKVERNVSNLNDLQRILHEKENIIGKLREELALAKRLGSMGEDSEKTRIMKENQEMRKDIKLLRELLDAQSNNKQVLEELETYKNRCEELTLLLDQWKKEPDHKEMVKKALLTQAEEFKGKMGSVIELHNQRVQDLEIELETLKKMKSEEPTILSLKLEIERLLGTVKQLEIKNKSILEEREKFLAKIKELEEKAMRSSISEDSRRRFEEILSESQAKLSLLAQENERLKETQANLLREIETYKEKMVMITTENERMQNLFKTKGVAQKDYEENFKKIKFLEAELSKKLSFENDEIGNLKIIIERQTKEKENFSSKCAEKDENIKNLLMELKKINELLIKERENSLFLKRVLDQRENSENQEKAKKAGQHTDNLNKISQELEESRAIRKNLEEENLQLKNVTKQLAKEIEDLGNSMKKMTMKLKESEVGFNHDAQKFKQMIKNLEEKLVIQTQEIERLNFSERKYKSMIDEIEHQEKIKKSAKQIEIQGIEQLLRAENNNLKDNLKNMAREIEELMLLLKRNEEKLKLSEGAKVPLEQELAHLKHLNTQILEELQLSQKKIDEYKSAEKVQNSLVFIEKQALEQENASLKQEIGREKGKTQMIYDENQVLKDNIKKLVEEIENSKNTLKRMEEKLRAQSEEFIKIKNEKTNDRELAEIDRLKQENFKIKEIQSNFQEEVVRVRNNFNELEEKTNLLRQENMKFKNKAIEDEVKIKNLIQEVEKKQLIESDIQTLIAQNSEFKEKIKLLLIEIEEQTKFSRAKDMKIRELELRSQGASEELERNLQREISLLKVKINEYEEKVALLAQENERLRVKYSEINKEIDVYRETEHHERSKRSKITSDIQGLEQEKEVLKKQNRDLAEELMLLTRKLQESEMKYRNSAEEASRIKSIQVNLEEKLVQLSQENERLRVRLNEIVDENSKLQLKSVSVDSPMKSEILKYKNLLAEMEEKLVQITQENERLRFTIKDVNLQKDENTDLKEKIKQLLVEIEEQTKFSRAKDMKIRELELRSQGASEEFERNLQREISLFKVKINEYEERVALLEQENERWRVKFSEINKELEVYRENERQERSKRSNINIDIQGLEQEREVLKKQNRDLAEELMLLTRKLQESEMKYRNSTEEASRIKSVQVNLEEKLVQLSLENERLRVRLNETVDENSKLQLKSVSVDSPMKSEILKYKNLLAEMEEKLVQITQENERLRFTIKDVNLQKDENTDLKEKIKQLLVEIEEQTKFSRAKDMKIRELELRSQGASEELERNLQREISLFKVKINEYEERVALLAQENERWRVKFSEINKELDAYRETEHQERSKRSNINIDIQGLEQEKEVLKKQNRDLAEELMLLTRKLQESEMKYRNSAEEASRIKSIQVNLEEKLVQLSQENERLRVRLNEIVDENSKLQLKSVSVDSPMKSEILKYKNLLAEMEEKLVQITQENERLRFTIKDVNLQKDENTDLKEKIKQLLIEIEEQTKFSRAKDMKIRELELRSQGASEELERNLQREISLFKVKINEYEERIALLAQENERWRVKFSEINKELDVNRENERQERSKRSNINIDIQGLEQEREALKKQNRDLAEELMLLTRKLQESEMKYGNSAEEASRIKSIQVNLEEKLVQLSQENERLRVRLNEIVVSGDSPMKSEILKYKNLLSEMEEKLVQISQENERLRFTIKDSESKALSFQEEVNKLRIQEANNTTIKTENNDLKKQIQQLLIEIEEQTKFTRMRELTLKELELRVHGSSEEIERNSQREISILKNKLNDYEEKIISLAQENERWRVKFSNYEEINTRNQHLSLEIEALKRERVSMQGIASNSESELNIKLNSIQREKEALMNEIALLRASKESLEANHIEEIRHYKRIIEEIQGHSSLTAGEKNRIEQLQIQNEQLMISLESANHKNRTLIEKNEELESKILERMKRSSPIHFKVEENKTVSSSSALDEQRIKDLMFELESARKKALELEAKLLSKDSKLTELGLQSIEYERLNNIIKQKDETLSRVLLELQESTRRIMQLQDQGATSGVSFEEKLRSLRLENEQLSMNLRLKEQELQRLNGHYNEEFNKLKLGFSGKEEGLSGRLYELSQEFSDIKVQKETLYFEKSQLQEKIRVQEEKIAVLATEVERLKTLVESKEQIIEKLQRVSIEEAGKTRLLTAELDFKGHDMEEVAKTARENARLREALSEKERSYELLQKNYRELESNFSSLNVHLQEIQWNAGQKEENERVRALLREKEQKIIELESKFSVYQESITKLIEEINELHKELKRKKEISVEQQQFFVLEQENNALKAEISSLKALDYQGKFALLSSEIERLQGLLRQKTAESEQFLQSQDKLVLISQEYEKLQIIYKETLESKANLEKQVQIFISSSNSQDYNEKLVMLTTEIERLNELYKSREAEINEWKIKTQELIAALSGKDQGMEEIKSHYEEKIALLATEIMRLTGLLEENFRELEVLKAGSHEKVKRGGIKEENEEKIMLLAEELHRLSIILKEKTEEFESFKAIQLARIELQANESQQFIQENEFLKSTLKDNDLKMGLLVSEIERLSLILREKQEEIENLQSKHMSSLTFGSEEQKELVKEYNLLKEKLQKVSLENSSLQETVVFLENKSKALQEEMQRLHGVFKEKEKFMADDQTSNARIQLIEKQFSLLQEENNKLKEAFKANSLEFEGIKQNNFDLQTDLAQKNALLLAYSLQREAPEEKAEEVQKDNETKESINIKIFEEENHKIREILEEKTKEIEGLKTHIEKLNFECMRIPDLKEKIKLLLNDLEKLNLILNEKMQENLVIIEENSRLKYMQEQPYDQLRTEYESQIAALKEQLLEKEAEIKEKVKKHGEVTEETENVIQQQQKDLIAIETEELLNRQKLEYARLEGESQALKETYKATILSLTERIEDLNEIIQVKSKELDEFKVSYELNEKETARLKQWQEQSRQDLETLSMELQQKTMVLKLSEEKIEGYDAKLEKLLSETVKLNELTITLRARLEKSQRDLFERDSLLRASDAEIQKLKEVITECRHELEHQRAQIIEYELSRVGHSALEVKCKSFEERVQALLQENDSLLSTLKQRQETLEILGIEKAESILRVQDLESKNQALEENLNTLLVENEKLTRSLDKSTIELQKKSVMPLSTSQNLNLSQENFGNAREFKQALEDLKALRALLKEVSQQNEKYKEEIVAYKVNIAQTQDNSQEYQRTIANLNQKLESKELEYQRELQEMRVAFENIRQEYASQDNPLIEIRASQLFEEKVKGFEVKTGSLIKNIDLLTKENRDLKEKLAAFALEAQQKESLTLFSAQTSAETIKKYELIIEANAKEMLSLREKITQMELKLADSEAIKARLSAYDEKVIGFAHENERLTVLVKENHEEILRYREVLLEKEVIIAQKSLLDVENASLREAKAALVKENQQFRKKLEENLKDINDLATDRKGLLLKIESLNAQISQGQMISSSFSTDIERLLKENEDLRQNIQEKDLEINKLLALLTEKSSEEADIETLSHDLQAKIEASIQLEIRNLKEKHQNEKIIWEQEMLKLKDLGQMESWKAKAEDYERLLFEEMAENERLKAIYDRQRTEIELLQGKLEGMNDVLVKNSEKLKAQYEQLIQSFIENEQIRIQTRGIVEKENEFENNLDRFKEDFAKIEENMASMMKEFVDKISKEKEDLRIKNKQLEESLADMNRFYSSEIHNLKTRFEASIIQKVEIGLKDVFAKMQSDKVSYERIILEKENETKQLKEIISKLEASRSRDLDFLKEEAFKIKDQQIKLLESERNSDKLSFVNLVEQLKAQNKVLESAIESKTEEISKLRALNLEKTNEIEILKEKLKVVLGEIEDLKEKFEAREDTQAVFNAFKEKAMLEMQIKNLKNTIESLKAQNDKLYERLETNLKKSNIEI